MIAEAQPPAVVDNCSVSFQSALEQLSTAHSFEVSALQKENNFLKLQVGQLETSLDSLKKYNSARLLEVCEPRAPRAVHSPMPLLPTADDDSPRGVGAVADDPEPEQPRHSPQVKLTNRSSSGTWSNFVESGFVEPAELPGQRDALVQVQESAAVPAQVCLGPATRKVLEAVAAATRRSRDQAQPVKKTKSTLNSSRSMYYVGHGAANKHCPLVKQLVFSPLFDSTCAFMIILNSVLIGWSVQYRTRHDHENRIMEVAGHVCSAFFAVELILRMIAQGRHYWSSANWVWSFFDTVLVIVSIVDFIMVQTSSTTAHSSDISSGVKTIKMLRIARVFRVFRFFRDLSLLALMILDSVKSLVWALVMLAVIIYVFAICFTQQATDYISDNPDEDTSEVKHYFGSLWVTVYSLVLSMLGGISWHVVSDALMKIDWLSPTFFFFYITFTILAVLNIITGVFVDNALETASTQREFLVQKEMELKERYITEMRELFMEMDADGSGTVSPEEIKEYFEEPRVRSYFQALGLDPADTGRLFHLIDGDASGEISVDEFLDGCLRLKGGARSIDVHALMYECKRLEHKQTELLQLLNPDWRPSPFMPSLARGNSKLRIRDLTKDRGPEDSKVRSELAIPVPRACSGEGGPDADHCSHQSISPRDVVVFTAAKPQPSADLSSNTTAPEPSMGDPPPGPAIMSW